MAEAASGVVGVWPLAGFDKLLHYVVPSSLSDQVAPGMLVRVPILNRHHLALVVEVNAVPDVPVEKLKTLSQVVYPFPALTADLLKGGKISCARPADRGG